MNVTGVELDPEVITLSYQFMGLKPEDAQIVNQDARVFISNTNQKYDIIVVDCYSQQIYIPAHLSTVQFFDTLRLHLNSPIHPLLEQWQKGLKEVNDELLANAQVLTDNHAPTEMLTDSMVFGSIPDRP